MEGGQDQFSDQSEARRHYSSHDEDDAVGPERLSDEGKSRGRSEGLDTLKCISGNPAVHVVDL